ncbi:signal peptidase complex subunit 1-like [Megachile rotundata]|uniref:signal peptidase complex subunit 1-like n=1 Tax=Megachile rotundata TaxID=143995 RepID=UPI0006153466|nr:PREDICTED: signal peptidase complex subunit 1-like [Megachile rotundata]
MLNTNVRANNMYVSTAILNRTEVVHISSRPAPRSYLFTMSLWVQYIKSIPTHVDYDGQARAEKLSRIIVTLFGVVGLIWGYIIQQFSQTFYILGAGLVMALLVTVPPWSMYRRKPLDWQTPQEKETVSYELKKKK